MNDYLQVTLTSRSREGNGFSNCSSTTTVVRGNRRGGRRIRYLFERWKSERQCMNTYLKFVFASVNVNSETEVNICEEDGSGDLHLMGRSWVGRG
jgi:hypothetical protein